MHPHVVHRERLLGACFGDVGIADVGAIDSQDVFADFDVHARHSERTVYLTRVIASKNAFDAIAPVVNFDISAKQTNCFLDTRLNNYVAARNIQMAY